MKKILQKLSKVVVLAIFVLAIYLLYTKLRQYSLAEIKLNLAQIPAHSIVLSCLFMLLNYLILIGYDWLALKAIHKELPLRKVCMVSFSGSVISNNFGALLGGSSIRYRLYSLWGFTGMDIVRLVLMLAVTYWIGAMGLAGLVFLIVPIELPPELGVSSAIIKPLGAALVLLCAVYLAVCRWADGRAFKIFGKEFSLPTLRIALAQSLVAGADLIVAAACLYSLLPENSGLSFARFLPNYLAGQVTTVLSHVPGGIGVLDVIIMSLTQEIAGDRLFASLLVFRVIYYLVPLMAVAVLLGCYELFLRSRPANAGSHDASRRFRAWAPTILAYAVFVAGAILCLSVMVPNNPNELINLRSHIPLWLVEISHLGTGLAGVTLLFLASQLIQRRKMAWKWALLALVVGTAGSIGKGMDWPEAIFLLCVLFPLAACRPMCKRIAPVWRGKFSGQWLLAACLVLVCSFALGGYMIGTRPDKRQFFLSAYTANTPRMLRTMAAEILYAAFLFIFYARAKIGEVRRRLENKKAN